MKWTPIAECPKEWKDGRDVWLYYPCSIMINDSPLTDKKYTGVGKWMSSGWGIPTPSGFCVIVEPTHIIALPAGPEE